MSRYEKRPCLCGHSKSIHGSMNASGKKACARLLCNCEDYRSVPAGHVPKERSTRPSARAYLSGV